MMTTETPVLRAWVGCLACYNAGHLVGEWLDGTEANDREYWLSIASTSRSCDHEELWVMDHEGYGGALSGECSPAEAQRVAEAIYAIPEHQRGAFVAYAAHVGSVEDAEDLFEEAYAGEWDSEREYAENLADDVGMLDEVPETFARYFNYEEWTRDLFMDDCFSAPAPGGGVYVFRTV